MREPDSFGRIMSNEQIRNYYLYHIAESLETIASQFEEDD